MDKIYHKVFEKTKEQLGKTSRFNMQRGEEIFNAIAEHYRDSFFDPKYVTREQYNKVVKGLRDKNFDSQTLSMFESAMEEHLGGEKKAA